MTNTANNANPTQKKLAGTPWTTAAEMKEAQHRILLLMWERFEKARVFQELSTRPEFQFYTEIFENGYQCKFKNKDLINVKLNKKGKQVDLLLSENISTTGAPDLTSIDSLTGVIKAMGDTFMYYYLVAANILPCHKLPFEKDSPSNKAE